MADFVSHCSWMHDIPDNTRVTTLSIPGTHDSCSIEGPLGFGKTQNLDLADQLSAGIRFLDIRLAHYQDNVFAHHNAVHMRKSWADILDTCSRFLGEYPTEAVLMSVKDEPRFDSILGRFAPSEAFGRPRWDPENWVIRSHSFEEAFKARTWQHVEDSSIFYNFAPLLPDGRRGATSRAFTSKTTLGEVRGKIVLLRRFEAGPEVGFDLTAWPKNQHFKSDGPLICNIEDCYLNPGEDSKYSCIIDHVEEARQGDSEALYITFLSAVGMKAERYSKTINQYVDVHLAGLPTGTRAGIIVMDYFEQPRKLVSHIIKLNGARPSTHRPDGDQRRSRKN